jgi:flavin reductase (DIM6/NTAB) family NADH-FMN oxidoreductase RutF
MPIEIADFKHVLRKRAGTVTIVTMCAGGECHGLTVMDWCVVSLDPPLVLVCIGNDLHSQMLLAEGCCFAINILDAGQRALSDRFAGRVLGVVDRLQGIAYHNDVTDAPILDECLAWLDCRIVRVLSAGDHTVYVAEVEGASAGRAGSPLLYYDGDYRAVAE